MIPRREKRDLKGKGPDAGNTPLDFVTPSLRFVATSTETLHLLKVFVNEYSHSFRVSTEGIDTSACSRHCEQETRSLLSGHLEGEKHNR